MLSETYIFNKRFRLKVKGQKKRHCVNTNPQKTEIVIPISQKIDLTTRKIIRNKGLSLFQKDIRT